MQQHIYNTMRMSQMMGAVLLELTVYSGADIPYTST